MILCRFVGAAGVALLVLLLLNTLVFPLVFPRGVAQKFADTRATPMVALHLAALLTTASLGAWQPGQPMLHAGGTERSDITVSDTLAAWCVLEAPADPTVGTSSPGQSRAPRSRDVSFPPLPRCFEADAPPFECSFRPLTVLASRVGATRRTMAGPCRSSERAQEDSTR